MSDDTAIAAKELFGLDGYVAVVTGGTRGLGRSIAAGMRALGARVVITGRNVDACHAAADELGEGVIGLAAHAGDPESADAVVKAAVDAFGGIDVVVNNAANSIGMTLGEITPAGLRKSVDVNLAGPLFLVQAARTHMTGRPAPSVINITTAGLDRPTQGLSVYLAAKAGLDMLTRTMAIELAEEGIRVNAISPGPFATDMVMNMDEDSRAASVDRTPLGRIADPSEIVGAAVFLASPAARFVTGATLTVDGGMTI